MKPKTELPEWQGKSREQIELATTVTIAAIVGIAAILLIIEIAKLFNLKL